MRTFLAEEAAFLVGGRSLNVGSCDASGRPTLVRGLACRVEGDAGRMIVFVARPQAGELLGDIGANGKVAVVLTDPPTHRTIQLKGRDATVIPLAEGDAAWVEASIDSFARQMAPLGFSADVIRTIFTCAPSDLAAVAFTPVEAFDQTPGPQAGRPLGKGV
ncbi:MAG TPA: hypothetical protein VJ623_13525 [Holophagaceae bacterium]|nr:hypothetical protein [Holophagaceae bacterium]